MRKVGSDLKEWVKYLTYLLLQIADPPGIKTILIFYRFLSRLEFDTAITPSVHVSVQCTDL